MNKVVTINLAGRAIGIEEQGFDAIQAYLKSAQASLANNPDRDEIISDIEAALAEKCATYLNANKNVVTESEAETIIKEMGPVAGSDGAPRGENTHGHAMPKRLFRIREGAAIGGVANGLAAYFDVDVSLVRLIFILLAIFTSGGFIFAYFLMLVFIPEAHTPEQRAASMGGIPTAQEIIDTVKRAYDTGASEWQKWKEHGQAQHKEWTRTMKEERRRWKQERRRQWRYYQQPVRSPFWEFMNSLLGLVWFLIILAICYWSYNHIPLAHDLFVQIGVWLREAGTWITARL